jgi:prevent-host-death family protein
MCSCGTNITGTVAELEIQAAAVRVGVPVLKPVAEHSRCDLAFDIGGRAVAGPGQVGSTEQGERHGDRACVHIPMDRQRTIRPTHLHRSRRRPLCHLLRELDRSFLLPASVVSGKGEIRLRLTPARNGQRACINLASDFEFEGAVAQLARASVWQTEGRGFESPQLHSSESPPTVVGCDSFRDRFGYRLDQAVRGEHLLITRRGRPLAKLIPAAKPATLWPVAA